MTWLAFRGQKVGVLEVRSRGRLGWLRLVALWPLLASSGGLLAFVAGANAAFAQASNVPVQVETTLPAGCADSFASDLARRAGRVRIATDAATGVRVRVRAVVLAVGTVSYVAVEASSSKSSSAMPQIVASVGRPREPGPAEAARALPNDGPPAVLATEPLPPPAAVLAAPHRAASAPSSSPSPAASADPGPSQPRSPSLAGELAEIDAARRLLSSGDAKGALSASRAYASEHPGGTFAPEAQVLRVDALTALGEGAAARAEATSYLAKYPQSPAAPRLRRLLEKE